jgi:hypothetical protein
VDVAYDEKVGYLKGCEGHFEEVLEVSPTMSLEDLEELVMQRKLEEGRRLIEIALRHHPDKDAKKGQKCLGCGRDLRIQKVAQTKTVRSQFGEVKYERPYGVCDRCGQTGAPMDWALGIGNSKVTVGVRQKVCHAAVLGRSFEDGAEILAEHSRLEYSAKHVRTMAEEEGRKLVKERELDIKKFRELKAPPVTEGPAPMLLVVTCDGGRVQIREKAEKGNGGETGHSDSKEEKNNRWKEDKIGVLYDATPEPNPEAACYEKYEGARAQTKTYVATMESWESFGWMLRVEAEKRGYLVAKEKLLIADGAQPIRTLKNDQFPEAKMILDWPHATEHLSASSKAAFGEGTPKAAEWYGQYRDLLWEGKRDEILRELQKLSQEIGFPEEGEPETSARNILYRNAYSYFPNNYDAIDYPTFRSKGWPLASGVAEGAVKQFALRMKGSEKFWNISQTGAEEMLALCALYHSEDGRWKRHWKARAAPYVVAG